VLLSLRLLSAKVTIFARWVRQSVGTAFAGIEIAAPVKVSIAATGYLLNIFILL
jgi:hypothetical protein